MPGLNISEFDECAGCIDEAVTRIDRRDVRVPLSESSDSSHGDHPMCVSTIRAEPKFISFPSRPRYQSVSFPSG